MFICGKPTPVFEKITPQKNENLENLFKYKYFLNRKWRFGKRGSPKLC